MSEVLQQAQIRLIEAGTTVEDPAQRFVDLEPWFLRNPVSQTETNKLDNL